jgi:ferredoxin
VKELQAELRSHVKQLLADGAVARFIGWGKGVDPLKAVPEFVFNANRADRLVVDHFSAPSFAKYLMDYQLEEGKTGIVAKGCDSLAVLRLVRDFRINREKAFIIGIPCTGVLDAAKVAALGLGAVKDVVDQGDTFLVKASSGEKVLSKTEYLLEKCLTCDSHNPVEYDILLGAEVPNVQLQPRDYADVLAIEALSPAEKAEYWDRQFSKCLRCYACRNVCPACSCRTCVFDQAEPNWVGASTELDDQQMFHFVRATHVAGRCVDCHECERVCPMDLPLMTMNHKLMRDIGDLFEIERPFVPAEVEPLGQFRPHDRDEFN